MISNISQLGDAANKLKAINFSVVGLNSRNIDAYRNAVSLLSKEQATLLLSSKGLNQAQIDLILSNKEVTASEIAEATATASTVKSKALLTAEQQKQLLASGAITSEKLAEIAATLGLETAENGSLVAKKALNVETVKQQLTSMGIVGSTQAQIVSMLGLTTAETGAATAGNILTGVMTRLGLAMSANPIGALVTVVGLAIATVWGLSKAFDALTDSAEEIDERVDSLIDKYNEAKNKADENANTVESLASEYEELSKGVNNLGENISLTSDEYDRYNQIVNQIADMFPDLISGYTEEGNAILSLKGNVEGLRDAYKEAQQEAYNLLVVKGEDSDGEDIVKAYKNLSELDFWDYDNVIGADDFTTTAKRDVTKQILDLMKDLGNAPEEYDKLAKEVFDKYGDRGYNLLEKMGLPAIKNMFSNSTDVTEEALKAARTTVQAYYQGYQSEINNKLKNIDTLANAFLLTNEDYSKLDNQSKTAASLIVNSLTEDIANEFSSKEDVGAYVANIVSQLKENPELNNAIVGLFTTDFSNETVDNAKSIVDQYINTIAKILDEDPVELKIRLGFDDFDALEKSYENTINRFTQKMDARSVKQLHDAKERNDIALLAELENKFGITDRNMLSSFFDTEGINTQDEIDYFNEVTKNAKTAEEAIKSYNEAKKEANESFSLLSISETVNAVNTNLKPALDSLKTVYQSVFPSDGFTLDDVDVSMLESLKKSFEDLKENGIDIATEDFENFTRVITDSSTTSDEAQRAFNKLATTLVNNSKVTLVSDDAFNTLVQTLEQLGITNAEEALQGLRDIQSEIASKGYDLANITNEQAAAFINEGNASAEAVTYLQYYMIQKQLAEQPLSTVGDVESLENLCNTLGVTGEMLQEVINLKNMMNAVNAGAPTAEFMPRIEESKKKIAELAKGEFEYKFDFKPKLDSSKASGSAKDIAEEFKNLLDAELKVLDTKMDAGLINFNDYIAQRLALIQKYYDEGKIKASDYYDYLSKHYETQLSYMDKVTSYVTTRIDKEIDGYNKQIDQIKEKYQTEIDYLDTVIDYYEKQKEALQDANTQRELQLALQKALYDLEKAQTQRSRKIYADNHGYIYRADGDAIRDAQDNLNKAKLDIQINEIDKAIKKVQEQQDALKKAMDKEVEAINKIIENLEAYKEKWSSIAKEYEEKQNEMIAQQMLGADIEKEILAGRLDVLEDFKNKYLAIQQAIKDANANAAQAALNEANKPSTGGSGSGSGNGTKITTPKSPLVSDTEKKRIQEENKKKKQRLTGGGTKNLVAKYANGTKNAEPGYHEIAENGDELIRDNYGNAYIAKGHQLHNFEGGETVYDAGDTKELLGGRLVPIESMPGISESLKNLMAYANTPDASQLRIQPNIPDYNMLKSVDSKSSTNSQVYVTQNVNVTLPNVTNEAGFNNFKKELDRLKLDAYQFANKRNK